MQHLSGFFNLIILLGAIQGFIISCLLYFSKENRAANRLFSFFIFFIALATLNTYLFNQSWYESSRQFRIFAAIFPMVIIMPLGPLLYFYTQASLKPGFTLKKRNLFHFYPVIIDLFPYLTVIGVLIGIITGLIKNHHIHLGDFIDTYNVYSDIPRWTSVTCYLLVSLNYINKHKKVTGTFEKAYQLNWLKQCIAALFCFQFIWLLYLIPYVIPKYTDKVLDTLNWYPVYVPLAILIYWLGIKGYLVMKYQQVNKSITPVSNSLPAAVLNHVIGELKKTMENDAFYLNPDLNLNMLSEHTGIPAKRISAVLNQHLNKSFN